MGSRLAPLLPNADESMLRRLAVVGGIVYPPAMGFISVSFGLAVAMLGAAALSGVCVVALLLVGTPPGHRERIAAAA